MQAGTADRPYYTNSSQLPVGFTDDAFEALERQDALQTCFTLRRRDASANSPD